MNRRVTRKAERKTNYLAALIASKRFEGFLRFKLSLFGIKLNMLYPSAKIKTSKNNKNDDELKNMMYYHSLTCPKCKKLGMRFWEDRDDQSKWWPGTTGNIFACSCGYHTLDANDLAAKNIWRRQHKNLPYFPRRSTCKIEDRKAIIDAFGKHLSERAVDKVLEIRK